MSGQATLIPLETSYLTQVLPEGWDFCVMTWIIINLIAARRKAGNWSCAIQGVNMEATAHE